MFHSSYRAMTPAYAISSRIGGEPRHVSRSGVDQSV